MKYNFDIKLPWFKLRGYRKVGEVVAVSGNLDSVQHLGLPTPIPEQSHKMPFIPGSIHNPEFRQFWIETLHCSEWVREVLQFGYRIPFQSLPGTYEEHNNKSVVNNLSVVLQIVQDLRDLGVIEFVNVKPHCVSPLGLVVKTVNGEVKHRLVLDASRWINLHVQPPAVKLVYLERALQITRENDFQIVFDLRSAYYNVKIAEDHVQYLGAAVPIQGSLQYFVFRHLPFGLNSAVAAITKLWKPLLAYFHLNDVRVSIYIDDGRILAVDEHQAERFRKFVYDAIAKAGWVLAENKSDGPLEAARKKRYLGFDIDSTTMSVTCPDYKLDKVNSLIDSTLECHLLPVRSLARLLGNIIALLPSHGAIARICTRSGYAGLEDHTTRFGWSGLLPITASMVAELEFFKSQSGQFNGQRIRHSLTDVRVDSYFVNPHCKLPTFQLRQPVQEIIVSDASSIKAAVKWLQGAQTGTSWVFQFSPEEQLRSSGERELLAVHKVLQQSMTDRCLERTNVLWATDSENLVVFLEKGSPKPSIQSLVFEILRMCTSLQCHLQPLHLLRSDERIRQVDYLSKLPDTDNWSVDNKSFEDFHMDFHFEVDLFADDQNKKVIKFVSKCYHKDALAVDAFSIDWNFMAWVCPPVSLLLRVIQRIRTSNCQGLLIAPNWPASEFYWELFENGHPKFPFRFIKEFHPYVLQNEGAKHTALFGVTPFTFFALYFVNKL